GGGRVRKESGGAAGAGAWGAGGSPAGGAMYRGDCSNAYTAQLGRVRFMGRLNGSTLQGVLRGQRPCPRGRLRAPCGPELNNSRFCDGTLGPGGRCEVQGYLYGGTFEGLYRCAGDGTPPGGFTGSLSFHR